VKKKHQRIQLFLILSGLLLILITYFYYPSAITQKKSEKYLPTDENIVKSEPEDWEKNYTTFENVKYEGIYDFNKTFSVRSEKAYIINAEPDIVFMTNMHVVLYLSDNRIVNIVSNKGRYNKSTHDCFFEENVRASDNETKIFAENLDLLATKNYAHVYNKVKLNNPQGSLLADKIDYDFETKYFKVSMFEDKDIKMKVIK